MADRVGSFEVGKDADIAIFTGNPTEVFTETVYTIVNGEIVYYRNSNECISTLEERIIIDTMIYYVK